MLKCRLHKELWYWDGKNQTGIGTHYKVRVIEPAEYINQLAVLPVRGIIVLKSMGGQ